jgi:outer membrane protein OmpA-like peptidoglycan-associated protein/tetratricopeptide (TPR) repeat protein
MKAFIALAFSAFILLLPGAMKAQIFPEENLTSSPKAKKWQDKAMEAYGFKDYDKAEQYCLKAISFDEGYILPYMMLGDIYTEREDYEKSIETYETLLSLRPGVHPDPYYFLGKAQYMIGEYKASIPNFKKYLDFPEIDPFRGMNAEELLRNALFRADAMDNPVPFNPENVGHGVNTPFDEYVNIITTDGSRMLFTRKTPINIEKNLYEENVFSSQSLESEWQTAKNFDENLNAIGNLGAITISPDGSYIFFTACHLPQGFGSCDLYYMRRSGDRWTTPQNLGPTINTSTWESQPSFSADGKTLYFASRRPGGFGSSDIWKSELQDNDEWGEPMNLGEKVNSQKSEMSPQIHQDGRTLYFSSMGHVGMGGYDLFYSRIDSNGTWGEPINLGYPVNTLADEVNIVVTAVGTEAYISSDQYGGYGKFDVYRFDLPEAARPAKVTYMKGKVFDAETRKPLLARFELIDLDNGRTVVESWSDEVNGQFLVCLPTDRRYALNVSSDWYLFHSENFNLTGENTAIEPFLKDIPMRKIERGKSVVLENIFYETDKYEIKPESKAELQKLIKYLHQYPSLKIEISGHTDNVGTEAYNLELSNKRAKSVYNYLVNEGISPERLTSKGFGFAKPVASNETEEGRAKNRRTEFEVVDY